MSTLTLNEAKAFLNIASSTQDSELQDFIDRAEGAIATACGPLAASSVSARVRGERPMLKVNRTPLLTLTSVTPVGGTALDTSTLVVERPTAGVVEFLSGGRFGARWYDVVYQCGWAASPAAVPADLKSGTMELLRHLWDTQRGGGGARIGSSQSESTANTVTGAHLIFPWRVEQLIGPFRKAEN